VLHQSLLDQLCSSLLACISQSAIQFLPLVNSRSSAIPGRNEAARSPKSQATQQKQKGYFNSGRVISVATYLTHHKRSHCIIA